jgi:hypothetical protein
MKFPDVNNIQHDDIGVGMNKMLLLMQAAFVLYQTLNTNNTKKLDNRLRNQRAATTDQCVILLCPAVPTT